MKSISTLLPVFLLILLSKTYVNGDDKYKIPDDKSSKNIFTTRIIGGEEAPTERFPYYVSLYRGGRITRGSFTCGATLIAPDFVLTAAHCSYQNFQALIGNTKLNGNGEIRQVVEYFPHEDYGRQTMINDIMLLRLESPVYETQPIELNFNPAFPDESDDATENFIVIGLGETEEGRLAEDLRYVEVPEYPFPACKKIYIPGGRRRLQPGLGPRMEESGQICAGGIVGEDSCAGDSGGPLIIAPDEDGSEDIQLGITSYGIGCANNTPAVYTRISGYENWIKDRVCENSQSPPDYCDEYIDLAPPILNPILPADFCFSGEDTVEIEHNTEKKLMKDLKIGDSILVEEKPIKKYEQVYSFGHRSESIQTEFWKIRTRNGEKLEVTKNHLIFVEGGKTIPVAELQKDMKLIHNGYLVGIESITMITREGMYAPLTPSGKLVVNGFQVSSFVAINGSSTIKVFGMKLHYQMISKLFESPRRMICNYIYGTCDGRESYDANNGISIWHGSALKAYQWLLNQNTIVFNIVFILVFAVVGAMSVLEAILLGRILLSGSIILAFYVSKKLSTTSPLSSK